MSCPIVAMRVTKNFPPALQTLVKILPVDKKPIALPLVDKSKVISVTAPPDCLRCGRPDHQTFRCTAKYDINGYEIGKPI